MATKVGLLPPDHGCKTFAGGKTGILKLLLFLKLSGSKDLTSSGHSRGGGGLTWLSAHVASSLSLRVPCCFSKADISFLSVAVGQQLVVMADSLSTGTIALDSDYEGWAYGSGSWAFSIWVLGEVVVRVVVLG